MKSGKKQGAMTGCGCAGLDYKAMPSNQQSTRYSIKYHLAYTVFVELLI